MGTLAVSPIQIKTQSFPSEGSKKLVLRQKAERIRKLVQEKGLFVAKFSDDGLSLTKYSLSLTKSVEQATAAADTPGQGMANLTVASAVLGITLGAYEMKKGFQSYTEAERISDPEGKRRAKAKLFSGTLITNASALSIAGEATKAFSKVVATGLNFSSDALFGGSALFAMGMAGLGAYRCYRFRSRLNQRLSDPSLSEVEQCRKALQFLIDTVSVTADEKTAMEKALDPQLSPEEKKAALRQKMLERTEVKVKYFKRRASTRALHLLCEHAIPLLKDLDKPTNRAEAIRKVHLLAKKIRGENTKKIVLFAIAFFAAAIAFTAVILGNILTGGTLSFALYAVASSIYLTMGAYSVLCDKLRKRVVAIPATQL